jgi:hypothetical protein
MRLLRNRANPKLAGTGFELPRAPPVESTRGRHLMEGDCYSGKGHCTSSIASHAKCCLPWTITLNSSSVNELAASADLLFDGSGRR